MSPLKTTCLKIVAGAWLAGWFMKAGFFLPYFFKSAAAFPVEISFFPPLFLNPFVCAAFYLLPVLSLRVFFTRESRVFVQSSIVMLCASLALLWHGNSYNDATFVTSFWSALWFAWLAAQKEGDHQFIHACFLGQLILVMIFLGGLVGKLTEEYFSGEIFYQLFVVQGRGSFFGDYVRLFSPETQRLAASAIAKIVIACEALVALSVLTPARCTFILALVFLPLLSLFSTWRIFSVSASLIGLAAAGLLITKINQTS